MFLRAQQGDLPETFIPLDKIARLKKIGPGIEIDIHASFTLRYKAKIVAEKKDINDLVQEIVRRRKLKKKFLINEWGDSSL